MLELTSAEAKVLERLLFNEEWPGDRAEGETLDGIWAALDDLRS